MRKMLEWLFSNKDEINAFMLAFKITGVAIVIGILLSLAGLI